MRREVFHSPPNPKHGVARSGFQESRQSWRICSYAGSDNLRDGAREQMCATVIATPWLRNRLARRVSSAGSVTNGSPRRKLSEHGLLEVP
jgi:hypothetical protein